MLSPASMPACVGFGVPGSRCSIVVDPVPDLLPVALGHAEDHADHLDRERAGEVGGEVERRLAHQRVQVAA